MINFRFLVQNYKSIASHSIFVGALGVVNMLNIFNSKAVGCGVTRKGKVPGWNNKVKQPSLFAGLLLRQVCVFIIYTVVLQDKSEYKKAEFLK